MKKKSAVAGRKPNWVNPEDWPSLTKARFMALPKSVMWQVLAQAQHDFHTLANGNGCNYQPIEGGEV